MRPHRKFALPAVVTTVLTRDKETLEKVQEKVGKIVAGGTKGYRLHRTLYRARAGHSGAGGYKEMSSILADQ